mmetsp:Transcript_5198/g.16292  ORF Transcript_5198/g.16292 Transcript_5198/m.16292 type:complete len:220 (+) Transcript_5198:271-930(+)
MPQAGAKARVPSRLRGGTHLPRDLPARRAARVDVPRAPAARGAQARKSRRLRAFRALVAPDDAGHEGGGCARLFANLIQPQGDAAGIPRRCEGVRRRAQGGRHARHAARCALAQRLLLRAGQGGGRSEALAIRRAAALAAHVHEVGTLHVTRAGRVGLLEASAPRGRHAAAAATTAGVATATAARRLRRLPDGRVARQGERHRRRLWRDATAGRVALRA